MPGRQHLRVLVEKQLRVEEGLPLLLPRLVFPLLLPRLQRLGRVALGPWRPRHETRNGGTRSVAHTWPCHERAVVGAAGAAVAALAVLAARARTRAAAHVRRALAITQEVFLKWAAARCTSRVFRRPAAQASTHENSAARRLLCMNRVSVIIATVCAARRASMQPNQELQPRRIELWCNAPMERATSDSERSRDDAYTRQLVRARR